MRPAPAVTVAHVSYQQLTIPSEGHVAHVPGNGALCECVATICKFEKA